MASLGLMGADVPSHPCDVYLRNARWGGWVTGNRLRGLRPPSCPITETWLLWAALPKDRSSGDPSAPFPGKRDKWFSGKHLATTLKKCYAQVSSSVLSQTLLRAPALSVEAGEVVGPALAKK